MLHVPSITRNFFVSKLAMDNNVYFECHSNKCFIKSHASNVVLLEGFLNESGLYCFTNLALEPLRSNLNHKSQSPCSIVNHTLASHVLNEIQYVSTVVNPNVWSIWHAIFGHANPRDLNNISQLCNIPIRNKNVTDFCNSCCVGKSHELFAHLSNTNYTHLFELVHIYLWGPSPSSSSSGSYNYYIAFVYPSPKYSWIYLLKKKSDGISTFNLFQIYVQT